MTTKQNELIYDEEVLKQHFPNWNNFPKELKDELSYWEANRLNLALLDPLSQDVPGEINILLEKARLMRWGLELKNAIDFSIVNTTPEQGQIFDELTTEQLYYLILMQIYSSGENKLPDLTTIGDPKLLEERLIILVYDLKEFNANDLFDKELDKAVLDEVLVAMTNDIPELANFVNKKTTLESVQELNKQLQKARPVKDGDTPYTFDELLSPKQGVPECIPSDISLFEFKSQQELDKEKELKKQKELEKKKKQKELEKQKKKQEQKQKAKQTNKDQSKSLKNNDFIASDFTNVASSKMLDPNEKAHYTQSTFYNEDGQSDQNSQIIQSSTKPNQIASTETLDNIKRGMTRINYRDGLTREELANEFDILIEHVKLVKEAALNSVKW